MPSNKLFYKKSNKFLAYLLLYFFTTHDLHFFASQLAKFLQNTPKRFQLKLIRCFALLNTNKYSSIFKVFDLQGVYFKVSGKFGGIGGSKKLRRTLVWFKPKFADRNLKLQRAVNPVWSFAGLTTWSIYAVYRLCLISTIPVSYPF